MIWVAIVFVMIGLFLSAFFSGSETGFYRATRTRLALDALSGDVTSRGLIWFTNNPSLFVASTLVGNNLANYLTSWSIVWATSLIWINRTNGVDLGVSILMTPVIFIYGELMPKNLFFQAPNRLLRLAGPVFLGFSTLFSPLAFVLWGLGRILERIVGESPERLQLRLVRSELKRVLSEGHEAGVLAPTQRQMADGMFELATMPLDRFSVPLSRLAVFNNAKDKRGLLHVAKRKRTSVVFIQDGEAALSYVNVFELQLDTALTPKVVPSVTRHESTIAVLTRMQKGDHLYTAVVDDQGRLTGIVDVRRMAEMVFEDSVKRHTYRSPAGLPVVAQQ